MRILSFPAALWSLGRKVEELLAIQRTTREALDVVNSRLRVLEDRMVYLEANQDKLVGEARSAASAASTAVAGAVISDVVTRLTRLEMHTEELGNAFRRRSRSEPSPRRVPSGNSGEHRRPTVSPFLYFVFSCTVVVGLQIG